MRKWRLFAAVLMLVTLLPAASAGADTGDETCGYLFGRARLQVFGGADSDGNYGEGTARVFFDGSRQRVDFVETDFDDTSPLADLITVQEWEFDEGTVEFTEYSNPVPIGSGRLQRFSSPVTVTDGGSGDLHYWGIFNTRTLVARYFVAGELCIDG